VQTRKLPLFRAGLVFGRLGAGFWLSALNVKYRLPVTSSFIVQFGIFVTPGSFLPRASSGK